MNIRLVYEYHPEKNEIVVIETDLTPNEFVVGINNKTEKIWGEYLHNSKQRARMIDGMVEVRIT